MVAEGPTVDNGGLTDYVVASDVTADGENVQIVKLALSADASRVAIAADADGLLVNTELPAAVVLSDALGNPTVPLVGSTGLLWTGGAWARTKSVADAMNTGGTGVQAVGVLAEFDDVSPSAVTENQFAALRMSSRRALLVEQEPSQAFWSRLLPASSGGMFIHKNLDVDETEDAVKTTPGQVFGWYLFNLHATAIRYVKIYDATVATVVVGTTAPVMTIPVPPLSGANVFTDIGILFTTAITIAATTGVLDTDTGAPGVNEVIANIFYV